MAYLIRLFGHSSNPVAHHACEELLAAVMEADPLIHEVGDRRGGVGWISFELAASRPSRSTASTRVEVNTRPDVLALCLQSDEAEVVSGDLAGSNVMVGLTLSGETDWQSVSAIWRATRDLWATVAWDEGSGFGASMDDL
ncbi:hypothetical protein [Kitasatospora sp. NPDC056184]|uniref:hypothetical protein n=1 Tax=Kitasatospora sp. NPDC056184 TaxID=3345738 RepID=UPI0035DE0AFD